MTVSVADGGEPAVAVVGSVHLDLVAIADRLPRLGETMPGYAFASHSGGKGGNQAVQVALAGVRSRFIGRVGRDASGDRLRAALAARGVEVDFLGVDPEAATGASVVLVERAGDYASIVVPGAGLGLTPDRIEAARSAIATAPVLLCQLELATASIAAAVDIAAGAKRLVVLNAAPAPASAAALAASLWRAVDVLVVNAGEAATLVGGDEHSPVDLDVAVMLRSQLGVGAAVVTLGADGALVVDADGAKHVAGHAVAVVDTIGAGDAFTGTLAAELARGRGLRASLPRAMAAGALAVTATGAYDALPSLAEIDAFLRQRSGSDRGDSP